MKRVLMAAAMALAFGGTAAKADIFDYAELSGGVTQDPSLDSGGSVDMKTGYNVGGALGWNIDPNISVDVDFFFTSSAMDAEPIVSEVHVESFSAMVNGFYSFDIDSRCRPYIGLGIGAVQVTDTDGSVFGFPVHSDSDIVFGYQGMVGLTYPLEEKIDLIAEYRYQGASDASLNVGLGDFDQE